MKNYKLSYIQNNTKEVFELEYLNTTIQKIKKVFQERIKKNGKTFIYFGIEEI